jgi:hypothetical protein
MTGDTDNAFSDPRLDRRHNASLQENPEQMQLPWDFAYPENLFGSMPPLENPEGQLFAAEKARGAGVSV